MVMESDEDKSEPEPETERQPKRPFSRAEKLIVAAIVLFLLNMVLSFASNVRLDEIEDSNKEVKRIQQQVSDDVIVIRRVADRVEEGNPQQAELLRRMIAQIDALYQVVVVEGESPR